MAQWKTLQRTDLKAFDEDMTKMILYAMEHGATGRISNNGHAILRNNDGQTMSVSRSGSGGSRRQNVARDLTRLFGTTPEPTRRGVETAALNGQGSEALGRDVMACEPNLKCPAKGCDYTGVTEGAIYSHVEKYHYRCPECSFIGKTAQARSLHHTRTHKGVNPAKGRTKNPTPTQPETPPASESAPPQPADEVVRAEAEHYDAVEVLERVREALGEDPRVAKLQRQVDDLLRERDDLKAQLSLVREALGLS